MPVPNKITYSDLRTALTQLGSAVSFPSASFPDGTDCLLGVSDVLDALAMAQTAQNAVGTVGEDVAAINISEGASVTINDPESPGTNILVQPRIYTISMNVERTISRIIPTLI
ncbi:MAG TPA: hypothetical protein DDZ60_10255 [Planktothrix sp. UBA10369]|jgi:hypothetical protein|nr:hypothetical protein [Planktothrix sp. UBA10369]